MGDPVVLSSSSLATYLRCGHQWYLAYVQRLREPPNLRQVIGIATHSAVEHNMAQKLTTKTDVPVDEMLDVYSDNFDSLVADVDTRTETEKPDVAKDSGVGLVKLHRKEVSPHIQPFWVEHAGQLTVDGVPYSYTIDLVDDQGVVRDLKTKARRPSGIEDFMLQLNGYALGYRHETGKTETGLAIDVLVRNQKPVYLPLRAEPVSDRQLQAFADTVITVNTAIDRGDFVPTGLSNGACRWCGFVRLCKYQRS